MNSSKSLVQEQRREGSLRGLPPALRVLLWMFRGVRVGELEVELPGGVRRRYGGAQPGPRGVLRVLDPRMARQVLRSGGIGLAEAYMDGRWDSPDLTPLLQVLYLNEQHYRGPYERNRWVQAYHRLVHRMRANTRRQARRNIEYHYDVGNDFYTLWLDPSLTYSSGLFEAPNQTLEQAQANKYRRILERLQLAPEHHLLEIGSGWGAFAIHAARATGCRVTSITLSPSQLEEARARAAAAGLADRITFELLDYRDLGERRFDRVASIEMYEAVGEQYWPAYFRAIAGALAPGGRAALQGITIREDLFPGYRRRTDFIQKYIFPGGMLASPTVLRTQAAAAGLEPRDEHRFGQSYADTLKQWHRNVLAARDAIVQLRDERFLRMWRYYLSYCEAGFRVGSVDVLQLTLVKAG